LTVGETKTKTSYLSLGLRIAIAVLACWIIYRKIDPAEVAKTFERLNIWTLILAVLVFNVGLCLIGVRWWVFMRAQDIRVPVFLAVKLTFLGQFFTNFMPSAVGGDVIRAWYVSRHTPKRLQAVLGVGVDRLMGLVSTFVLAITSYLLFMRGQGIFHVSRNEPGAISAFFERHPVSTHQVLLVIIILLGIAFLVAGFFDVKRFFKQIWHHFIHVLKQFKEALFVYYHHPWVLCFGLTITIFLQSLVILSFWLVGRDMGMQAALQFYFVFFPMVWVIGSIPVSIAGIGILEGGIVLLFVQFTGAEPEAAIALALCQRLTWVVASFPGLLVHLGGTQRHKT
jgi:uncharacterized membrane protein YbhN (UPF0104 family)